MLRFILTGASAAALLTAASCAQEDQTYSQNDAEADAPEEYTAESQTEYAETQAPYSEPEEYSAQVTTPIVSAAQVTTRDEAKMFAETEFKQADLNSNGAIDREEFIAYEVANYNMNTRSSNTVQSDQTDLPAEGDTTVTAQTELEVADADLEAEVDQQFAKLSKGDEAVSQNELVEARVADFDEADANGDEKLDTMERQKFAQLVIAKSSKDPSY